MSISFNEQVYSAIVEDINLRPIFACADLYFPMRFQGGPKSHHNRTAYRKLICRMLGDERFPVVSNAHTDRKSVV